MPNNLGLQSEAAYSPRRSIARLATARAAFVGRTLRGPVERPVLITDFAQFQHVFGGLWQPSTLCYSVEQFFDNGGLEALVVRVANGARAATLTLPAGAEKLVLRARRPGTREFLRACVDYDNIASGDADAFNLTVQRVRVQGAVHVEDQETFRNLSMLPGSPRHLPSVLAGSELISAPDALPPTRPDCTVDAASGLATGYVHSNADGDDGAPLSDYDLIGSAPENTGMFALAKTDHFDFLCLPPLAHDRDLGATALLVAARICRERRALLIVDPPSRWQTAGDALEALGDWSLRSENAVMYFPRILAYDKLRGHFETFAPCGAVAGLLARGDAQTPVWDAGEADEPILRPGYKPACTVGEAERRKLAALGVNALQSVRSAVRTAPRLRTLTAGGEAEFRFLRSRRAALYIVNCIERGTRWVAAARPHAALADLVASQVREFLADLHRAGAFAERSAEDAFFVICDRRINADDDAHRGPFQLLIGFAAARIGEFHTYRITQRTQGSEVQAVTLNRLHDPRVSPAEAEWVDRLADQLRV
ncbi:MAG TPA: hypothetical protein VMV25_09160 [Steroidobacteraceae bacterium]|nr:hypothetical protein [Steroidobacteraceae bacterium]